MLFFALHCFILSYELIFSESVLCLSQCFYILRLFWDTEGLSPTLPVDTLLDIQQFSPSVLPMPSVTVCEVMSFSGKANIFTYRHEQLSCVM